MDREQVVKTLQGIRIALAMDGHPNDAQAVADALALLKALSAFKDYFGSLYGQGLEVVNWHLNGATEPFDNFYESAIEESGVDDGQGQGD